MTVVTAELMSAEHGQQFPEKRMWVPALAVPPAEGLYQGLPVSSAKRYSGYVAKVGFEPPRC